MVNTIIATLPLALGIALNPIAVVAGVLILRGPDGQRNGIAFLGGWILGMVLLLATGTGLVHGQLASRFGAAADLPPVVWLGLGAALLVSAFARVLRGRPLPGEEPELPWLIRVIDHAGPTRSFGAGMFLAIVSVRNLALVAAAAGVIGSGNLEVLERTIAVTVFVAVSSIGLLVPVLLRVFGGDGSDAVLATWGDWLTRHMSVLTALVVAVLGFYCLGKGLPGVL